MKGRYMQKGVLHIQELKVLGEDVCLIEQDVMVAQELLRTVAKIAELKGY